MKLTRKALVYGLTATALPAVGCSSSNTSEETRTTASIDSQSPENVGEIALQLDLPGGRSVNSVSYSVTNEALANSVIGTYTFPADAGSNSFVISGIPLGTGYDVSLRCTSTDGAVTCSGTAAPPGDATAGFDVTNGTLAVVNVLMTCTVTVEAGEP